MTLRKNLYSQKFKNVPIKPSYVLEQKTRTASVRLMEKYTESQIVNDYGNYTDSLRLLYSDFVENYRLEKLPDLTFKNGKVREAVIEKREREYGFKIGWITECRIQIQLLRG